MKKIVVTGGAGFIGSALVRGLLAQGNAEIAVIDNLLTGYAENLDEVSGRIAFHAADIRDYDAIAGVLQGADCVYHLAAIPSVPRSIHDPVPSHQVNVDGTFNVLRACVEGNVRRVVYAASSSAYGDTATLPKVESMAPDPRSPYAAQKLMGEQYARAFHLCYGLDAVSLRFFNVYGERQDPGSQYSGVISKFMTAAIRRVSPVIYGDGEHSRDFTYVEDVIGLCMLASQAQGVGGKVYNAGNGNRHTLNELWRQLQWIEGVEIPVHYAPAREGDVRDSQADTTAARRDLGHDPQYTLEQGLRRTLAWYRANQSKAVGKVSSDSMPSW